MKTIAGIICRRLLTVILFICCSAVVCCGVSKHAFCVKSCGYSTKECNTVKEYLENAQPSQLVSIRIMELI
ncbi:MAG TPA: hypothetical protein VN958_07365 [Chitinophagaceae bacterium]|nr:hypothetical protein [Chitinophagaceae bacterium]